MSVDIQTIIDDIQEAISTLHEVETRADEKIATVEEIRNKASDISSTLEDDLEVLSRIEENTSEVDSIVNDAEYENII